MTTGGGNPNPNQGHRVKVYELNAAGTWDDKGTGYSLVEHGGINVKSEEDGAIILDVGINSDDIYQRQGETIISWSDPRSNIDTALSFQQSNGCLDIWEQICVIQGRNPYDISDIDVANQSQDEGSSDCSPMDLPSPDLSKLVSINQLLMEASTFKRDSIISALVKDPEYLRRLMDQFRICVEIDDFDDLYLFFNIFKNVILLNDHKLFDYLFDDSFILDLIEVLQWDPDIPRHQQQHRKFIETGAVFKEVVDVKDDKLMKKIHQNYRLQYIQDVILARILDDSTFASLNNRIFYNNQDIIKQLSLDERFLDELFYILSVDKNDVDNIHKSSQLPGSCHPKRSDAITLLQELCSMSKQLSLLDRSNFLTLLVDMGIFNIIETILNENNITSQIKLRLLDVIDIFITLEPSLFRMHILGQTEFSLMSLLLSILIRDHDIGIKAVLGDIIIGILDPESNEKPTENERILNMFYESFIENLIVPILEIGQELATSKKINSSVKINPKYSVLDSIKNLDEHDASEVSTSSCVHVVELLAFCVRAHDYRSKYFFLRYSIIEKSLELIRHPNKHLVLTVIRFFRTVVQVGLRDEFYNRHIVKNHAMAPIVELFLRNGDAYNLINSAILQIFELIKRDKIVILAQYLVSYYKEEFLKITYVKTFQELINLCDVRVKDESTIDSRRNGNVRGRVSSGRRDSLTGVMLDHSSGRRHHGTRLGDDDSYFLSDDVISPSITATSFVATGTIDNYTTNSNTTLSPIDNGEELTGNEQLHVETLSNANIFNFSESCDGQRSNPSAVRKRRVSVGGTSSCVPLEVATVDVVIANRFPVNAVNSLSDVATTTRSLKRTRDAMSNDEEQYTLEMDSFKTISIISTTLSEENCDIK